MPVWRRVRGGGLVRVPERYRQMVVASPEEAAGDPEWCSCRCDCGAARYPAQVVAAQPGDWRAVEGIRKAIRFDSPQQAKEWQSGRWVRWAPDVEASPRV
jgi:hypothetical protein